MVWFGDTPPLPPPWLVKDLLPQAQVAIVAGQWAAGKTFVAADLSACVMLGVPFAGREIVRKGAVLWLAAEGANEVDMRVEASATARNGRKPDALPFARQAFDVPRLTAPDAEKRLLALAKTFNKGLVTRFPGVELATIVIDTMGSAAGWTDANNSAEAQAVMNMLRRVNGKTGALVLVVDHYGKVTETGVMGASAKAQSADAILAALSDRDIAGNHTNRRMAVVKVRGAAAGAVTPFALRQVPTGTNSGTTCIVEWSEVAEPKIEPKRDRSPWKGKSLVLKQAIEKTLLTHGRPQKPLGDSGPEFMAVEREHVRAEFYASYSAEDTSTKRKAFNRLIGEAQIGKLIGAREIDGSDWLWLTGVDVPPTETESGTSQ